MYILYSTRMQGWLTQSSTYSSEHSFAKQFMLNEALEMCARHRIGDGVFGLLPIQLSLLETIIESEK